MPRSAVRRVLIGLAAVPVVAGAVLAVQVELARRGPMLPDGVPGDLDGRLGGPGPALRITWLGDSTAAGIGATVPDASMARRLATGLDRPVELTVLAVSGDQVGDVLDDQLPDVAATRPDVVLISAGANDVTRLTRLAEVRSDYRAVLDGLPDDVAVVVLGVPDMGSITRLGQPLRAVAGWRGDALGRVVRAEADRAGAAYVDIAGRTGPRFRQDPERFFAADRYHPSDEGYALWADAIEPVLAEVVARRGKREGTSSTAGDGDLGDGSAASTGVDPHDHAGGGLGHTGGVEQGT